ncbi:DUF4159 domain-containing protein [Lutimaribacter sp. EGI FJ00015]|uniref:DUF4159 domain-containing protein n=1 Tax=Lutimaribacter degradans TaxID=2945989 RepID=A0ACC5ZWX5_9RHOB|nr:DUF4159 domain-containing protein [Lutimaribacter sp. EGI FJ00013]MCM2562605.1 DUF4159 domain-containing protein [Lutimaribacter sp. EGI FJ00013]MCO0613762.1 DUF4159 domain-containing protein [Lutimaribacter sp. EGI FJ00015]MCO0636755.1 DUF4159 domain-containing protein [Lutimaribacter sp. EGI FJ00014]
MTLGPIGFAAPWLLVALVALPILWLILRAIPPAPIKRRFPGVALLLGLTDDDTVTDRTPWWLLLLRMLAVAAVIVGLAGPILNPEPDDESAGNGPVLFILDGGWTGAQDWTARADMLDRLLAEAGRAGRTVAVLRLTTPETPLFQAPAQWQARIAGLTPQPWEPSEAMMEQAADGLGDDAFDTVWLSDGVARPGRDALLTALERRGAVRVIEGGRGPFALLPATFEGGIVTLTARRLVTEGPRDITVAAHGLDPAGVARVLARLDLSFAPGEAEASGELSLPAELRGRITRFEIEGLRSAGAVALSDDSLRRREVALIAGRDDREGLELLEPLHYLRQALEPSADLLDGALTDVLPANPDVVVLADVATLSGAEQADLLDWVDDGGLLLRFAGPRLAASDVSRSEEAPLMPVRLRAGGRTVGGAMSWGEPKSLAPFPEDSPFYGLDIPGDVRVSAQVMAQPDPTLADRVIAQLSDGTPLVTRKRIGQGQVVLVHVTANAEWSTLPLSGLFVDMLERLAVSSVTAQPEPEELEGSSWQPRAVLDGFGRLDEAQTLPGVDGADLVTAPLGPELRPGVYEGDDRRIARNAMTSDRVLAPANWPARIPVEGMNRPPEQPLGGWLLALALLLLAGDVIATLALSGRLRGDGMANKGTSSAVALLLGVLLTLPGQARAQDQEAGQSDDAYAISATSEVVLAHVLTGNRQLDDMAEAGMRGLADILFFRTSVEPAEPIGVNLENDDLSLFPMLYWPVTPEQPTPSADAYAKLNRYLRSGGMILFDTRDADVAGFGAASPNGRKLQELAGPLDIPPLEQVPGDHVLTRTFYLLQDFPGRHVSRDVWVEAAPADAEQIEGMPFRNLNDGVTPVVIGGNDWAAAWAMDDRGNPIYPVGRGFSGERQRELAYRFGVNLVMHVLTGNYKSDQVHVPALLDRLGN